MDAVISQMCLSLDSRTQVWGILLRSSGDDRRFASVPAVSRILMASALRLCVPFMYMLVGSILSAGSTSHWRMQS